MGPYAAAYERSLGDPARFWAEAARDIRWRTPPERVLDDGAAPFYRWFTGGELNTCENALDRHVEQGRGDQLALIYDSPVTGPQRRFTYRELRDETALFAGVLRGRGVERGDRVVLYLPMIPQAVVAMLACARIGAVHSVVFGGFAPRELAVRIDDARPKLVVSASCGVEGSRVIEYKPLARGARAAAGGLHDGAVRGQTGRHAGRRGVLAGGRRAPGQRDVHRAHGDPGDLEGGPGRPAAEGARPVRAADALPRRRAPGPRHLRLGRRRPFPAGDRPLVSDRDRVADRGEPARPGADAGQARLAERGRPRL